MRGLNTDQLRTFLAVIECGSFSAAARRLNLSQPAVSTQIGELERRFGVSLIERLGKHAHVTSPGRELVEAARNILDACEQCESTMRRYRDGWLGSVRVSTTLTGLMYLLPPILRRLVRQYPGLELHVTNKTTRDSVESVLGNAIDLAIVTLPVVNPQLSVTALRPDPLMAIFPVGTKNLPDVITPEFVANQSLLMEHTSGAVHDLVINWLTARGQKANVRMHLGTVEAIKLAVASELGMSIVPQMAVKDRKAGILIRPLHPSLAGDIGLIEYRIKPNNPALEIVRNELLGLRQGTSTVAVTGPQSETAPRGSRRPSRSRSPSRET